jgi:hypothetical protein
MCSGLLYCHVLRMHGRMQSSEMVATCVWQPCPCRFSCAYASLEMYL